MKRNIRDWNIKATIRDSITNLVVSLFIFYGKPSLKNIRIMYCTNVDNFAFQFFLICFYIYFCKNVFKLWSCVRFDNHSFIHVYLHICLPFLFFFFLLSFFQFFYLHFRLSYFFSFFIDSCSWNFQPFYLFYFIFRFFFLFIIGTKHPLSSFLS